MNRQLSRFLVVGVLTVVVDGLTYRGLNWAFDGYVEITKAIGFIAGTVFSYFANKHFTFGNLDQRAGSWWRFALLYASTLAVNVGVNSAVFHLLDGFGLRVLFAFLIATACSATLNFLGMKVFVFRARALTI